MPLSILVVGGGVAGPSLGISLKKLGVDAEVTIVEAYPKADPNAITGSYFTLQDNGVDALKTLGALDAVRAAGVDTTASNMMRGDGGVLARMPFGNSVTVKRGKVNLLLMDMAAAAGCNVRYSTKVVAVEQQAATQPGDAARGGAVSVTFGDGSRRAFDLVVGADGVHSMLRTVIDPVNAPAGRYVGLVNYAGIAPPAPEGIPALTPCAWNFCFALKAFILYHVRPDGHIIWGVNEPRDRVTKEERASMTEDSARKYLVELFAEDRNPLLTHMLSHGPIELMGDNQCDLGNVPKWFNDERNIVLVGDAVHAPSPTSGQGGSMALEDGIVLAKALHESNGSLSAALEAYESFRRARVEKIVANGARMSKNKMPGRVGRFMRDLMMPLVAKCVDMEELNRWVCDYRIAWDLPLAQQPAPPVTSMRRVFFGRWGRSNVAKPAQ